MGVVTPGSQGQLSALLCPIRELVLLQTLFTLNLMTQLADKVKSATLATNSRPVLMCVDGMGTMGNIGDMYLHCQSSCDD